MKKYIVIAAALLGFGSASYAAAPVHSATAAINCCDQGPDCCDEGMDCCP